MGCIKRADPKDESADNFEKKKSECPSLQELNQPEEEMEEKHSIVQDRLLVCGANCTCFDEYCWTHMWVIPTG